MFGKRHCGWLPWFSPLKIGFDVFFGNLDGSMDYFCQLDTAGKRNPLRHSDGGSIAKYAELVEATDESIGLRHRLRWTLHADLADQVTGRAGRAFRSTERPMRNAMFWK